MKKAREKQRGQRVFSLAFSCAVVKSARRQRYLVSDEEFVLICFSDGRVDGGYGEWTQWSRCLQTCSPNGGQTIRRSRQCNAPPPMNGGSACVGPSVERVTSCFNKCPSRFFSF